MLLKLFGQLNKSVLATAAVALLLSPVIVFAQTPTVSVAINGGASHTNSRTSTLNLVETGSPNQMYKTNTAGCASGGSWVTYAASSAHTLTSGAGTKTVYVKVRNAAGTQSTCVSDTIILDTTAPTLAVTVPTANDLVNAAEASAFAANGTCSESGQLINLTGGATASFTCSGTTWSGPIDFSAAAEGTLSLTFTHADLAGNVRTVTRSVTKDTIAPTGTISINAGAIYTNSTSSTLTLSQAGTANQMYITNTDGCGAGGSWATFNASRSWTLPATNATNTIYVKFRDAALNESPCYSDSIVHDNTLPTLTVVPANSSVVSSSNAGAFPVSGTCTEDGINVNVTGAVTSSFACSAGVFSGTLDLSALAQGTVSLSFAQTDVAGNTRTVARSYTKDTNAPTSATISINAGATYTTSMNVTLTLSATGTPTQRYVTNTAGCAADGVWETYSTSRSWTLAQAGQTATVYVKYRDAALNESICVSDTIVQDGTPPAIAIVTPVGGTAFGSAAAASFPINGTCSENTRNVSITGATTGTFVCSGGFWSGTLNLSGAANGNLTLTATHTDVAGNSANTSVSVTKDTTAPASPTVSINAGAALTNSLDVTLTLSATGSPTEVYVTSTSGCGSGGSWVPYATSLPRTLSTANASNTVYAKYRDAALNESTCASDSITHDNISPTLTIINPVDDSFVYGAAASAVAINGTCSENGRAVVISGAATNSFTCTSSAWSGSVNVAGAADGSITLIATQTDAAGNSTSEEVDLNKDTVGPTPGVMTINSGAARTNSLSVTLQPAASVDATQMYITNTAGCGSGGAWETFAASKAWNITTVNALNTVYIKYRDVGLNQSSCANATITHDNVAPTLTISSPTNGSVVGSATAHAVAVAGTCSENARQVAITGAGTNTFMCTSGNWSGYVNIAGSADGVATLTATHTDAAGNSANTSVNLTKDTVPPSSGTLSINSGAAYTLSLNVTLTLSAGGSPTEMYITNTAGCGADGSWETYSTSKAWTLATAEEVNSVFVRYRDAAHNESACVSDTITHDPLPSVLITSPLAGAYVNSVNQAAYTVSGTCSPSGHNVEITGDASATVLCLAGNWSANLDFSAMADGSVTIYADYKNAQNISAVQDTRGFSKSTGGPSGNSITPWGKWNISLQIFITNQSTGDLTLASTDATDMYITNDPACSAGGAWEAFNVVKTWTLADANQTTTVYAKFRDVAGSESSCLSSAVLHDNIAPTFAVDAPVDGAIVNGVNKNSFVLSGTCSDSSRTVYISGMVSQTAICWNNVWTRTLALGSFPDGNYQLNFNYSDGRGNEAPQITRSIVVQTQAPTGNSLSINGGALSTNNAAVTLTLASTGASEMYVTADRSCGTAGTWEPFSTTKAYTLGLINRSVGVYAKFRTAAGNVSPCVGATIIHDIMIPYWMTVPTHVSASQSLSQSPVVTYVENAIDNGSGLDKYMYAVGTGTTGIQRDDIGVWTVVSGGTFTASGLTLVSGSKYYINMKVLDKAGNEKVLSSTGWTVDFTPPVLTVTSPAQNDLVAETDLKITGTCETGATVTATYGSGVTGTASSLCTSGVYFLFATFTGANGARTIDLSEADLVGNTTNVHLDLTYSRGLSITGQVNAIAKAADGSIFYGGNFLGYSSTNEVGAVRINTSGVKDASYVVGSGFNGNVLASAELPDGSILYGGDFTSYRGRKVNYLAKVDSNGDLDLNFSPQIGANGTASWVRAIAVSGSAIYIGGDFTGFKNKIAARIAKIDANGTLDTTFNPPTGPNGTTSTVRSIVVSGSSLYIGGDFTSYRGTAVNRVAKIDALTGVLDTNFTGSADASVTSLAIADSTLYVGGSFASFNSSPALGIARVSLSTGAMDTVFSPSSGANGIGGTKAVVNKIAALSGGGIVAVGSFATYRGAPANNVALIDANGVLDANFSPATGANGFNGIINSVLVSGTDIYIGGLFQSYRGSAAVRLAKVSTSGTLDSTFNPSEGGNSAGLDGSVNSMILSTSGAIYVGGSFTSYRPTYIARNILKTDASGNIDTGFNPQSGSAGFDNVVRALAIDGTSLYVGGDFTEYAGASANRIAKLDMSGTLDTTFTPSVLNGFNGLVRSIAVSGSSVYAGGDFTRYQNKVANRIVKLDKASGALDTDFSPATGNGVNGSVYAVAASGSDIFIGGLFNYYKTTAVGRVAKLNGTTGALDATFSASSGADGAVFALVVSGSDVYIGGAFLNYNGAAVARIAKVSATTGVRDASWGSAVGTNGLIYAMAEAGSSLIFTGYSTTYMGQVAKGIVKVSLSTGILDTTFNPPTGANGLGGYQPQAMVVTPVGSALLYDGSTLYVGGGFTQYRGKQSPYSAKLDLTTGNLVP